MLTSPYSSILLEFSFSGASHRLWILLNCLTGVIGSSSIFHEAILKGLVAGPVEWPEYGPEAIFLQKGSSSKFDYFRLKAGGEKSLSSSFDLNPFWGAIGESKPLHCSYLNWMLMQFLGLSYIFILVKIFILSLVLIVYKFNEIKSI